LKTIHISAIANPFFLTKKCWNVLSLFEAMDSTFDKRFSDRPVPEVIENIIKQLYSSFWCAQATLDFFV
jgi:hypothetical protein